MTWPTKAENPNRNQAREDPRLFNHQQLSEVVLPGSTPTHAELKLRWDARHTLRPDSHASWLLRTTRL